MKDCIDFSMQGDHSAGSEMGWDHSDQYPYHHSRTRAMTAVTRALVAAPGRIPGTDCKQTWSVLAPEQEWSSGRWNRCLEVHPDISADSLGQRRVSIGVC